MPLGCFPGKLFWAHPTGRRPQGRLRTHWRDYISHVALERLGIPQEKLEDVAREGYLACWPVAIANLPSRAKWTDELHFFHIYHFLTTALSAVSVYVDICVCVVYNAPFCISADNCNSLCCTFKQMFITII